MKTRLEIKDHYATEADTRKAIEEILRNWEFDPCLEYRLEPDGKS